MNALEKRTTAVVAVIFLCRMMGLFMVLPVISLYGQELEGATLGLLGIAVGAYGLSQALLQIPLSMMSDRYGRRRIILLGLFIFFLGSLCTYFADTVWALIVGRAIQGAGAIAGTSMALLADNSRSEFRSRVMAFVGISIGASFVFSLVLGPWLVSILGLRAIFMFSTILALSALVLAYFGLEVSESGIEKAGTGFALSKLKGVFGNMGIMSLAFSVAVLHLIMTASFLVIPLLLEGTYELSRETHWQVYLGVFFVALLLMGPFARAARDENKSEKIYLVFTLVMVFALGVLALESLPLAPMLLVFCLYFLSFNLLEALLPSLMSQKVDESLRATAMGVFSSFQFFGAFLGGLFAGYLAQSASITQVFALCACLSASVFVLALGVKIIQKRSLALDA